MRKDNCIFCKIVNGEIPSRTLYEDEMFKAILDVSPASKGHTLVLPKEHADNLFDLPQETAQELLNVVKKVARMMCDKLGCDGINLVQNNGEAAGQTVKHFHMHIIPRYQTEPAILTWEPKAFSNEELDELKKSITE